MHRTRLNRRRRGFTLIEIAIAVAIIAVLAVSVLIAARYLIHDSKIAKVMEHIDVFRKAAALAGSRSTMTSSAGTATTVGACDLTSNFGQTSATFGSVGNAWTQAYPSTGCPAVDGTAYGIAGVGLGGDTTGPFLAVKANCTNFTDCALIWKQVTGKMTTAPAGTITWPNGMTACTTAEPATAMTQMVMCFRIQ